MYETLGHKVGREISFSSSGLESLTFLNKDLNELLKEGQDMKLIPYKIKDDIKPQIKKELESDYEYILSKIKIYLRYLKEISKQ